VGCSRACHRDRVGSDRSGRALCRIGSALAQRRSRARPAVPDGGAVQAAEPTLTTTKFALSPAGIAWSRAFWRVTRKKAGEVLQMNIDCNSLRA
jgi:hypothetical protein